jgi:drug/metabolite transporter superfamily protein YnfA
MWWRFSVNVWRLYMNVVEAICELGGGYLCMWWRLSMNVVEAICEYVETLYECGGGYL